MVMKNDIDINEYNNLINESNIINNQIKEIDKDIICSNEGISLAKKNVKGAFVIAGISFATCIATIAFKVPSLVSLISAGITAVSFNWALTAANYINIQRSFIIDFSRSKKNFLIKQDELKKRMLSIEKTKKNKFDLSKVNETAEIKTKNIEKTKVKIKNINNK